MTDKEFRNLEVGKTFQVGNVKLRVEEAKESENLCDSCYVCDNTICECSELIDSNFIPECGIRMRADEKDVIFVEVKK